MGFKRSRVQIPPARVDSCFTFTFCKVPRQVADMWVHVRTSMNVFVVTTSAIRKPHATASHGLWYTVKAFLVVPTPQERSAITNQVAVAMNSIDGGQRVP